MFEVGGGVFEVGGGVFEEKGEKMYSKPAVAGSKITTALRPNRVSYGIFSTLLGDSIHVLHAIGLDRPQEQGKPIKFSYWLQNPLPWCFPLAHRTDVN